jgi:tetratricopeptide (TPR) repeat protein
MGALKLMALRLNSRIVPTLLSLCLTVTGLAQDPGHTVVRHHAAAAPESAASALLDRGESLLAKGDFTSAKPILEQATEKDPKSYQAWYDLGYAEQALNHRDEAISAYRKSLEINAKTFETNLNLGLTLAATGQNQEAMKFLKTAIELQPASHPERAKEHAWLALGQLQLSTNPEAAQSSFLEAMKLQPTDAQPHLLLAGLYESSGKLGEAKSEYQQSLNSAQGEDRLRALRGLVNVAVGSRQYADAEADVRQYLAADPKDAQAHLLLGRLLAAQGKNDEALAELNSAGEQNSPEVLREKAELLTSLRRENEAIPIYKALVAQNGNDAQLRYQYGLVLMHQLQWPSAEEQLLAAVKLNANLATAYGDLAICASQNQHYDLSLKALDVRTKFLGDNPGTFFLRATALDHLRRYPEATVNYKQFLAAANGKYPDEEWKARHRLIAIEKFK